ncbi:MAG: TonB family protein [Trichormus sp. ATA11-4-KO1]|jgi:TonB family protein|nr:TonB family protein [Trichormus sp. ATA11-4-KO1]
MSFSGVTVEHRSQEVEALRSFLIYSLIGSLALHIGVLSSGIGNFLMRVPQEIDEPIEVAIIDTPAEEPEKPPEVIPEEIKIPEPSKIITSNETPGSPGKSEIALESKPQITTPSPVVPPPPQQTKVATEKPQPTSTPPKDIAARLESILTSQSSQSTIVAPPTNQGSEKLRAALSGLRDSRESQTSSVESNQPSSTNSVPQASTPSTNNTRVKRPPIAAAPTTPQIRTESENNRGGNSRGAGNGRADCSQCNASYPEFAKRQGIEGRVEVAVDTDAKGNVTNVRIVNSSGNSRLDEETLRQARNWKLKPAEGGRQGVSIATEFALQGSQRYRQVQERKRQQEAQARERSRQRAASSPSSPSETSTPAANTTSQPRTRRETTPAAKPAPVTRPAAATPVREPRQPVQNTAAGSSSGTRTTPTPSQRNVRESLRNVRRQRTSNNSAQQSQPSANRRPRPTANTSSPSQNNLRNSLRRSRQADPEATSQE